MPDPIQKPCLDIGNGLPPMYIYLQPGATIDLTVHICPLGYVEWMLTGDSLQEARHGTMPRVIHSGSTVSLHFDQAGIYALTWAATSAEASWTAASLIHVGAQEVLRQTVSRENDQRSPIIFGVGIKVQL